MSQRPTSGPSNHREQSPTWEDDYATWQAGQSSQYEGGSHDSRNVASAVRNRLAHRPHRHPGPGSDSGSSGSGKSSGSDSLYSRAPPNAPNGTVQQPPPQQQHPQQPNDSDRSGPLGRCGSMGLQNSNMARGPASIPEMGSMNGACLTRNGNGGMGGACGKVNRFKGKRLYPSVPNQPSEASAHFMFELAKTVLTKAGGNSSTSLFTQPINSQNPRGPHRALHMCAFQIGLYALGLHNCVSAKWLSRTYSSHVSWITGNISACSYFSANSCLMICFLVVIQGKLWKSALRLCGS